MQYRDSSIQNPQKQCNTVIPQYKTHKNNALPWLLNTKPTKTPLAELELGGVVGGGGHRRAPNFVFGRIGWRPSPLGLTPPVRLNVPPR